MRRGLFDGLLQGRDELFRLLRVGSVQDLALVHEDEVAFDVRLSESAAAAGTPDVDLLPWRRSGRA
ncbi:hypothetical protein D3C83_248170 [compost metagenome]